MFKASQEFTPVTLNANPADYHAIGADKKNGDPEKTMSRSELRKFSECESRWKFGEEKKVTDTMDWGSLIDCLLLTPDRFSKDYSISPDKYTNEKGESKPWNWNAKVCSQWWDEQKASGKEIVTYDDIEEARFAVNRILSHPDAFAFTEASDRQVMIRVDWHDEETGIIVPFKCLIDLLPVPMSKYGDTIGDLKTTKSAQHHDWTRSIFNDGLHYQAALYIDAVNAATGFKYEMFSHVLSENFKPYEPAYRPMSLDFIQLGRDSYTLDIKHYCRALNSGIFKGYDSSMCEPEPWMLMRM